MTDSTLGKAYFVGSALNCYKGKFISESEVGGKSPYFLHARKKVSKSVRYRISNVQKITNFCKIIIPKKPTQN